MRPPRIEAAALLAAHGFTDAARAVGSPTLYRWRPRMAESVRFALIPANPEAKIYAFPDIDALARHIQRARGMQGLELVDVEDLEVAGSTAPRPGVTVFTLDAGGDRDRLVGHAWLDGRGQEHLRAALRRNRLVIEADSHARAA